MSAANSRRTRISLLLAAVVFARALIPAGYMPGGAESNLPFVLCPEGVPAGFLQFLAGSDHDHGHGQNAQHDHGNHQCLTGHMLSSAAAVDHSWTDSPETSDAILAVSSRHSYISAYRSTYRSRGPPA